MTSPTDPVLRWDVPTLHALEELRGAAPPAGLRAAAAEHSFHRDIYFDTAEGALSRRDVTCRVRIGADDVRRLTITLPAASGGPRERFESIASEHEPPAILAGASESARRLRGLVDPAELLQAATLEVSRTRRPAEPSWPWRARYLLEYDAVTVRREGLARGFQELRLRELRRGHPSLQVAGDAITRTHQLRPVLDSKLARVQRLLGSLEREAIARSLGSGRCVTLLALDAGTLALRREGRALRLPALDGSGEATVRQLLRETFGSGAGDLSLLGTAPGPAGLRLQEVWLARRLRRDGAGDGLVWVPVSDALSRAGAPGFDHPETMVALALASRSDLFGEGHAPISSRPSHVPLPVPEAVADPATLLDEDASVLEFNRRVLALAEDDATPLLERLGFLAIVSANLDEFYMVNVGALKRRAAESDAGRLEALNIRAAQLVERQYRRLGDSLAGLAAAGIRLRAWAEIAPAERALLTERFRREIFPSLAPRAITAAPGFPVQVLPGLELLLAVILRDGEDGPSHLAVVKLPERLPRFLPVTGGGDLIALEEVVRANVGALYPDRRVAEAHLFRLTRAADLELEEDRAGNLLQAIEEAVGRRSANPVVRVEVERGMPPAVRDRLLWELRFEPGAEAGTLTEREVMSVPGLLDLRGLRQLLDAPVPGGRYPPFQGTDPFPAGGDLWRLLDSREWLVHHPYDAFDRSVGRFFTEAAEDPAVVGLRATLYRVGERSPVVESLLAALRRGKDVSLFVELKARFDEARNAGWVRRLEEAGANVAYGVVGLKNHAKLALVVRREGDELRRYVHVGTGNYNAATARVYTDLGLFSADPELGADVNDLFNQLTGSSHAPAGTFRRLRVAPAGLLPWLLERIDGEASRARAGDEARIRAKLNGVADAQVVQALYAAAQAGVGIELIVRGICTLRPGVPGLSERIRVVSRLGRFLEHARIYEFGAPTRAGYFIGSADWRPRNLRRRIEAVVPVEEPRAQSRLRELLDTELADPGAWVLHPDGSYSRAGAEGAGPEKALDQLQ
jgi:polyphosphate kinase